VLHWLSPLTMRVKRLIVNPDYSSTRFAESLRAQNRGQS